MPGVSEKSIYRLWWEFLKRSEDYEEFCIWTRERQDNPGLKVPDKFKGPNGDLEPHPFFFIFRYFLDIHADTYRGRPFNFEVWWQWYLRIKDIIARNRRAEPVQNYADLVLKDMDECIRHLTKNEGREPGLHEFKDYFVKHIRQTLPPKLFMEIEITREETGVLMRDINNLLIKEKEALHIKYWELFNEKKQNWPKSKFKALELKRCLLVYDQWKKGLKIQQIVLKIGTAEHKKNYNDENIIAGYMEDLSRAKRIISNVEQGVFPGFYGKYSISDHG